MVRAFLLAALVSSTPAFAAPQALADRPERLTPHLMLAQARDAIAPAHTGSTQRKASKRDPKWLPKLDFDSAPGSIPARASPAATQAGESDPRVTGTPRRPLTRTPQGR